MPAWTVARGNRFCLTGKENTVACFHSFAGSALQCSINFEPCVTGQYQPLCADKCNQLPAAGKTIEHYLPVIKHTDGVLSLKITALKNTAYSAA